MNNNTIILLIIFFSILIWYLVYINKRKQSKDSATEEKKIPTEMSEERKRAIENGECCGQHEVCERDSLINTRIQAEYYDDEELDQFKGRNPESYTEDEIKLFNDVFYTLKEGDVSGWLKSMQIREIEIPQNLKDEALFIIQERRFNK